MNTYLKAEKMKYRHTFLWWLMILMPAVSAFLSAQLLIIILPWTDITGGTC